MGLPIPDQRKKDQVSWLVFLSLTLKQNYALDEASKLASLMSGYLDESEYNYNSVIYYLLGPMNRKQAEEYGERRIISKRRSIPSLETSNKCHNSYPRSTSNSKKKKFLLKSRKHILQRNLRFDEDSKLSSHHNRNRSAISNKDLGEILHKLNILVEGQRRIEKHKLDGNPEKKSIRKFAKKMGRILHNCLRSQLRAGFLNMNNGSHVSIDKHLDVVKEIDKYSIIETFENKKKNLTSSIVISGSESPYNDTPEFHYQEGECQRQSKFAATKALTPDNRRVKREVSERSLSILQSYPLSNNNPSIENLPKSAITRNQR